MKKEIQKKSKTANRALLWKAGIFIGLALVLLAVLEITQYMDGLRFVNIDKKKSVIANELSTYLGDNVTSVQNKKECFNTGQGPYDDGYLWCQTSTIFGLKHDIDPQEFGSEFLKASSSFGTGRHATGYGLPLYFVELTDGSKCYLGIKLASGNEVNGARSDPFYLYPTKPAVAVTCGDRAKAKHYPYNAD